MFELFDEVSNMVPSVCGPSGIFTGLGRLYCDCNKLEWAICEMDDCYELAVVRDQVFMILREAAARVRERTGVHMSLANDNHAGLLERDNERTWGCHGNYLVDVRPTDMQLDLALPFLVTRLYQGAGGVRAPSGVFVAGARSEYMDIPTGGGTTERGTRAIFSTARDENHMGPRSRRFRLHLISKDGQRSMWSEALLFGATALTWCAIRDRPAEIRRSLPALGSANWVGLLHRFNCLARPGAPPRVHPLVVETQRVYLEAASRCADAAGTVPGWVERLLGDWSATLRAMEQHDLDWLCARLDPFIKWKLMTSVLEDLGHAWRDVPGNQELLSLLAVLSHRYHEFSEPNSPFDRLEAAGVLAQRVADVEHPSRLAEPWVPRTGTRAKARARFIVRHARQPDLLVQWESVLDGARQRRCTLHGPFDSNFSDWEPVRVPDLRAML